MNRLAKTLPIAAIVALAATARADTVYMDPNDPGKITHIAQGVWELGFGALGVLSVDSSAGTSTTRVSTDGSLHLRYYIKDNISVGVQAIVDYDSVGDGNSAVTYGGALEAAVNLRLGLGAFFRPGIALGGLFGTHDVPQATGTSVDQASQAAFTARLELPLAYFGGRRWLIEAGPQLVFTSGSYSPSGGDSVSFTTISGGFAIGAGYVF